MRDSLVAAFLVFLFGFGIASCTITTNNNGYYIGVYDDTDGYSWHEAKDYCMRFFGSSLASVHSSTDAINFVDARPNSGEDSWTGLNDINSESIPLDQTTSGGWAWSDGTPYDYAPTWDTNEPSGNQDCGQMYADQTWDDDFCWKEKKQFICNLEENWRAIFKISNGLADYGGQSNSQYFWTRGELNYDNYVDDVLFANGSFSASEIDTENNYRSLIVDDWEYLFNNGGFDKVKISLYKNESEVVYFIYNATSDSESWMTSTNLIDSSYHDLGYEDFNFYGIDGTHRYLV